jgi:hypothetical protein
MQLGVEQVKVTLFWKFLEICQIPTILFFAQKIPTILLMQKVSPISIISTQQHGPLLKL